MLCTIDCIHAISFRRRQNTSRVTVVKWTTCCHKLSHPFEQTLKHLTVLNVHTVSHVYPKPVPKERGRVANGRSWAQNQV